MRRSFKKGKYLLNKLSQGSGGSSGSVSGPSGGGDGGGAAAAALSGAAAADQAKNNSCDGKLLNGDCKRDLLQK